MKRLAPIALAASLAFLAACSNVPEEAVTLSLTVQKDIQELERANIALARQYFGDIKEKVNRFIDETYAPQLIAGTLQRPNIMPTLRNALASNDGNQMLQILRISVEELVAQIEKKRAETLQPITLTEIQVRQAIEDSYGRVQNAQAIISGHLASQRQVQVAQDQLLGDVGLQDLRGRFIETTAGVSNQISAIISAGETASAGLEDANARVQALDNSFSDIAEQFRLLRASLQPSN